MQSFLFSFELFLLSLFFNVVIQKFDSWYVPKTFFLEFRQEGDKLRMCFQGNHDRWYPMEHYENDTFTWVLTRDEDVHRGKFPVTWRAFYKIEFKRGEDANLMLSDGRTTDPGMLGKRLFDWIRPPRLVGMYKATSRLKASRPCSRVPDTPFLTGQMNRGAGIFIVKIAMHFCSRHTPGNWTLDVLRPPDSVRAAQCIIPYLSP